jgi:neutral ceramidase
MIRRADTLKTVTSVRLAMAGTIVASLLAGCGSSSTPDAAVGGSSAPFADSQLARCMLDSPLREVGAGLDARSQRLEVEVAAAVGRAEGPCADNTAFRFGSGIYDITGPVALKSGAGWEDPAQVMRGIHQRQFARAFSVASPCNGKRVMLVVADIGMVWGDLRVAILDAVAADPVLSRDYRGENVMLSATHTHNGPAGFSHHHASYLLHLGFDPLVRQTIVDGTIEAMRLAHANLQAHPQSAPIRLASGELLNANINRSRPAFAMNPQTEREQFLDTRGEEVDVNKRMVQLNLARDDGSGVGAINWFGVHATVLGPETDLVSSDNKGFASLGFERIMRTRYDAPAGEDRFVAAFAQADEGDASPNIFILERPHPDPTRGGGENVFESLAISGTKQLAGALELWAEGGPLRGPVDFRLVHVPMNQVRVEDPEVLSRLHHPPELDSPDKRTCNAALGVSFPAGAEDGPGPLSQEGVRCDAEGIPLLGSLVNDLQTLLLDFGVPLEAVSELLLCNLDTLPLLGLGCHAEKPVLLPLNLGEIVGGLPEGVTQLLGLTVNFESPIQPLQIVRIGNLALVGLPWEVTTMSARRLRALLLEELAPVGIDTVIIGSLTNDFVHYLTTREEYASQQYEGASTIYGPWSLAAVMQETRRLALSMVQDTQPAPGPEYPDVAPLLLRVPYIPLDPVAPGGFGSVVEDVPATATPGETVTAIFRAGHPRNDLRLQDSFVYAEQQQADGTWVAVARDRDPELLFVWAPLVVPPVALDLPLAGPSNAEVQWRIPRDIAPGTYRLRHVGRAVPGGDYEGISSPFTVTGEGALCP